VKAARAVRAIAFPSVPGARARIEHGQTNQKLITCAHGYNKKKNALILCIPFFSPYEPAHGIKREIF